MSHLFEGVKQYAAYDGGERGELLLAVWTPTPWMLDVRDGSWDEGRQDAIRDWCTQQFGPAYDHWSRNDGAWQRGTVTLFGWTWYGFRTEEMRQQFCEYAGDSIQWRKK